VTGGLGWVLYEAGAPEDEPKAPAPKDPQHLDRSRSKEPDPDPMAERGGGPWAPHLPVKPVPSDAAPRIPIEGHDDLKLRNWKDAAAAVDDMRAMQTDMIEKGMPDPQDAARIETMQRRYQHFMQAVASPPPGLAPDKPSTQPQHPAFAVNLVAAILERANLPLTEAQSQRLAALAKERGPLFDAADEALREPDPEKWFITLAAQRATLGDAFHAEVHSVLTPAQSEAVAPADRRGRLRIDVVSSVGAWGRIARPMLFTSDAELTQNLTGAVAAMLGVREQNDAVRPIVEAWVAEGGFPAADLLDARGFTRTSHFAPAVPRMVLLLTRVIDGLKLPEEAQRAARGCNQAFVPLRQ
jgi:hypothetical protein